MQGEQKAEQREEDFPVRVGVDVIDLGHQLRHQPFVNHLFVSVAIRPDQIACPPLGKKLIDLSDGISKQLPQHTSITEWTILLLHVSQA